MPKMKLTDAAVARLELSVGKTDLTVWDTEIPGFGIRLRPAGKTWIVGYRPVGTGRTGQFKRHKIGPVDIMKTAEARVQAKVVLGRIATGGDPLAERKLAKANVKLTLSEMLDRYDKALELRRYVNRKDVLTSLRTKLKPLLGRDIRNITAADVAAEQTKQEEAGLQGAAKGLRTHARAFMSWCCDKQHVIPSNPLMGHRKERATRADKVEQEEHGRAMSDAELVRVWNAADQSTAVGRLTRFYILTGCRRGEGAGLTRAMVEGEANAILLPAEFTKQARPHYVPLIPALASLLETCTRDSRSDLVFPSSKTGGEMSGWSKFVISLRERSKVDFTLHDIRRTFRTGLSRLGVDEDTAELAIGHARGELVRIYNRDKAIGILWDAFQKWADHVEKIVAEAAQAKEAA